MGFFNNLINNPSNNKPLKITAHVETPMGTAGTWTGNGYEYDLLNDILKKSNVYLHIIKKE